MAPIYAYPAATAYNMPFALVSLSANGVDPLAYHDYGLAQDFSADNHMCVAKENQLSCDGDMPQYLPMIDAMASQAPIMLPLGAELQSGATYSPLCTVMPPWSPATPPPNYPSRATTPSSTCGSVKKHHTYERSNGNGYRGNSKVARRGGGGYRGRGRVGPAGDSAARNTINNNSRDVPSRMNGVPRHQHKSELYTPGAEPAPIEVESKAKDAAEDKPAQVAAMMQSLELSH